MSTKFLEDLARLRVAVGCLGERDLHGWWECSFFAGTSKAFLVPVFTRTAVLAQYHGVTEAAARVHDDHIGIGQVYHLFRLPGEIEHGIDQCVRDARETPEFANVSTTPLDFLKTFGTSSAGSENSTGPTRVADTTALSTPEVWREVAAQYRSAFESGRRIYPYFSSGK